MKIQDIIKKFEEDYSSFKLCNQVSKPELDKLKQFLQDNLALMLEDIEKDLPKEIHCLDLKDSDPDYEERLSFQDSHNKLLQEVINIINSHR